MPFLKTQAALVVLAGISASIQSAQAQTAANISALNGLAPLAVLENNDAGKAAMTSNYKVTAAVQNGSAKQPLLVPFAKQQQQALRDAFITAGNGLELSDGLGSKLGAAYKTLATYTGAESCAAAGGTSFTVKPESLGNLIAYSYAVTASDAGSGKFFFSNATTNGKTPVDAAAQAILTGESGTTDVFGKAYNHVAGSAGADPYGDSRPFQTEPTYLVFSGKNFFGVAATNSNYLTGPIQCLDKSPAFPSGHTTYGYTESLVLAELVPARFTQMITRGAEYGNDRIIMGAHYAMDVLAGRTLATYDMADLLANNPTYLNQKIGKAPPIADYQAALKTAKTDLQAALAAACGGSVVSCAAHDNSRFKTAKANAAFYQATQTYGLAVVYPDMVTKVEDVATLAPEAGYILTTAFPKLTLAQADKILTDTQGPGGGFLDDGKSVFGVYSRLNLYKAGEEAKKLSAKS